MHPRFTLPVVSLLCLGMGIAAGWNGPRFSGTLSSGFPDEPWEPGQCVLVLRTDPNLDCPATATVTGERSSSRRWVFSFRDPDAVQRACGAARDAVIVEHRRALDWP